MTNSMGSHVANLKQSKSVVFVTFDEVGLLDLTGPQTTFWIASQIMQKRGFSGYSFHTVSARGGLIRTAEGMEINTVAMEAHNDFVFDTVLIPGSPKISDLVDETVEVVSWLRATAPRVRRIVSVCTGAFLLAEAGLLDGKRAATHWEWCDMLKSRFPRIDVDPDPIFIHSGGVWTSAGVTAGIDLALALVEADCGRSIAMEVASQLVTFLKRPGDQSQFSVALKGQMVDVSVLDNLHLWMASNHSDEGINVIQLADRVNMSPRNFARVYKQRTGRTPAKTLENMRMESAKRMLGETDDNIESIAQCCGFGDVERMRIAFKRNLARSPKEYRLRLRSK